MSLGLWEFFWPPYWVATDTTTVIRSPLIAYPRQSNKLAFTWINQGNIGLIYAEPLPALNYHWPVPRTVVYPTALRTWTQGSAPWIEKVTVARATVLVSPRPLDYPIALRTWVQSVNIGLLQSGVAQDPVAQHDWPAPRILEFPIALRTWIGQTNIALLAEADAQIPRVSCDWRLPRGQDYPTALRTFIGVRSPENPVSDYEWPLPRRALPAGLTWINQVNIGLQTTAETPPALTYNFALARTVDYPTMLRTWISGFQPHYFVVESLPFNQTHWPLPRTVDYPITSRTWLQGNAPLIEDNGAVITRAPLYRTPQKTFAEALTWINQFNIQLQSAAEERPFAQYDWPVPRTVTFPITLRTLVSGAQPQYRVIEERPISQNDWPVPRRSEFRAQTWINQTSIQLAAAVEEKPPFNALWPLRREAGNPALTWIQSTSALLQTQFTPCMVSGWDTPRAPDYPVSLRTWISGFQPQYQSQAAAQPPANYQWPTPQGPSYPIGLRTWISGSQPYYHPLESVPFNQYHWPLARTVEFPVALRTIIGARSPETPVKAYEWPIPRTPEFPTALRTFIGNRSPEEPIRPNVWLIPRVAPSRAQVWINQVTHLLTPEVPPPSNYRYPVPKGQEHPIALRTWLSGFQPNYQPAQQTLPPSNYRWPVPRTVEYPTTLRTWIQQTAIALNTPVIVDLPLPGGGDRKWKKDAEKRHRAEVKRRKAELTAKQTKPAETARPVERKPFSFPPPSFGVEVPLEHLLPPSVPPMLSPAQMATLPVPAMSDPTKVNDMNDMRDVQDALDAIAAIQMLENR